MLQTTEFFQEQIKQCRDSAARSHNKGDHDFWLKMAHRWEALLQIRQPDGAGRPDSSFIFCVLKNAAALLSSSVALAAWRYSPRSGAPHRA
jgi:hypothetical protein